MKKYHTPKRILLKLSGEALQWKQWYGIDPEFLTYLAEKIVHVVKVQKIEVAIVVGGGNIFRGIELERWWFDRATGDNMGMLATIINGIAIGEAIEDAWVDVRVMSAIPTHRVAEDFIRRRALRHIEKGRVVICVWGTGNPYFTTDTAASLRAIEIGADVILKGTRVDGIYSSDPEKDKDAVRYETVTFDEVYEKGLKVMDLTAFTLCNENKVPIIVFDMNKPGNLLRVLEGERVGTLVEF